MSGENLKRGTKTDRRQSFMQKFSDAAITAQKKRRLWGGELSPPLEVDTLITIFFVLALIMIPCGIAILIISCTVQEIIIDYTDCEGGGSCQEAANNNGQCQCSYPIDRLKDEDFQPQVYVYYMLTNFNQNHAKFRDSRTDKQKRVDPCIDETISIDACIKANADAGTGSRPMTERCPAIAHILFNDTFQIIKDDTQEEVNIAENEIDWPSDEYIYSRATEREAFAWTVKPSSWRQQGNPNITKQIDTPRWRVWMRTAALPDFRKLWGRIEDNNSFDKHGIPKGNYTLKIDYKYPTKMYGGRKFFILSNTSILGGYNNVRLGIAYAAFGILCLLIAVLFCAIKRSDERKMAYWKRNQ